MKRFVCILISFLLSVTLYAETKTSVIELQGAYGVALNMNITPIAAQTESFISGMPFNIEEEFVKYQPNSDGRAIATWNVLSNTKFDIYIKADNMVPVLEPGSTYNPDVPLSYILTFSYNLSYADLTGFDGAGSFWLTSGVNNSFGSTAASTTEITVVEDIEYGESLSGTFYKINLFNSDSFNDEFEGFTGSVDGRIFFKFTEEATKAIEGDNDPDPSNYVYPVGDYTASVTFFVEAK